MTAVLDCPQLLALVSVVTLLVACVLLGYYYPLHAPERVAESEERACRLLRDVLTESERRQLSESGYLLVPSPNVAGREYRVPGHPGYVDVREEGKVVMRVCVQPIERLPTADVVLMHKLMIEGNEREYLRQANIQWVRPRRS